MAHVVGFWTTTLSSLSSQMKIFAFLGHAGSKMGLVMKMDPDIFKVYPVIKYRNPKPSQKNKMDLVISKSKYLVVFK